MTKKMPRDLTVVGVDPSLTGTGLSLSRKESMSSKNTKLKGDDRLRRIYAMIVFNCMGADMAVVEDLPLHAKSAGKTGMAQGAVRMALRDLGVPYVLIPAATIKKAATGSGRADKMDMRKPLEDFHATGEIDLNLKDDDQVDAFWMRECAISLLGYGSLLADPSALDKYATAPPVVEVMEALDG